MSLMNAQKPTLKWESLEDQLKAEPKHSISYVLVMTEGKAIPVFVVGTKYKKAMRLADKPIELPAAKGLCETHYAKLAQ